MGKKTAITGVILIVVLTAGLMIYQKKQNESIPEAQTVTVEQEARQETMAGYEDEESLIKYML